MLSGSRISNYIRSMVSTERDKAAAVRPNTTGFIAGLSYQRHEDYLDAASNT